MIFSVLWVQQVLFIIISYSFMWKYLTLLRYLFLKQFHIPLHYGIYTLYINLRLNVFNS